MQLDSSMVLKASDQVLLLLLRGLNLPAVLGVLLVCVGFRNEIPARAVKAAVIAWSSLCEIFRSTDRIPRASVDFVFIRSKAVSNNIEMQCELFTFDNLSWHCWNGL